MDHLTLTTRSVFAKDEAFLLTRAELTAKRPEPLHVQDFHEVLWVQNGEVRFHTEDGRSTLTEGDVLFISPDTPHGLQGRGAAPMVVSLAIRPGIIKGLGTRHEDLSGIAFWTGAGIARTRFDSRTLADLNRAALRLEQGPRSKFSLEAFLLPLLAGLDSPPLALSPQAPHWLRVACAAARNPAVFRDGAAGFVSQTGRAHPHVSRSLKRFLGQTPSEYINSQRMTFAARQLVGTSDSLAEIADDCGIPNLSHFHKLFYAAHGETPRRYRRARQHALVQPQL